MINMQARIFILGFVQGVGFRQFVKKNARDLKLKGYVQNTSDGRVEVVAQGSKKNVQTLIKICEKGPFFSEVKSIQAEWEEVQDKYSDFEILR